MLDWVDKVDGVDAVLAKDINSIAHELENKQDKGNYAEADKNNTFNNINTFKQGVIIEGGLAAPHDTVVWNLSGTDGLNVYDELEKIKEKASLTHINTFTEENIFRKIVRSEGAFFCTYDTHITSIEGKRYNVVEELEKIDGKADILEIESNKATALLLTDTKNAPLIDYKIYGNTNGVGTIDGETGKTLIPVTVQGKNLLPIKSAGTYSFEGIGNCEIMEDGGIYVERVENTATTPRNASVCSPMTVLADGKYRFTEKGKTTRNIYTVLIHKRDGQIIQYYSNQSTNYDVINLDLKAGDTISTVLQIKAGATVENTTFYLQLELGSVSTSYEKYIAPVTTNIYIDNPLVDGDYIDYRNKKVVAQGVEYTDVNLPKITVNYPSTSIFCNGEMQVTYKADTTNAYKNLKSELDTLKQAIISAGGTM